MQEKILSWQTHAPGAAKKGGQWYWTVGIIGSGIAIATFIIGNLLLGILIIIAVLAIMLAGSRPSGTQTCSISDKGVHIGGSFFPFGAISQFAIHEEDPKRLTIKTSGFMGTISISLDGADFRAVRTELKNRNVEEVDRLESFGEKIAEMIGM